MNLNSDAVEELSNGNYVCKICTSYLTLGKNEDIKRDNLHIHFNGRRHKFRSQILRKSFVGFEDYNNYCSYVGNINHGIFNDTKLNFNFYCSYCDCVLPQLSKDRQSNVSNISIHLSSRRHNFNVLQNYAKIIINEDPIKNESCTLFDSINFEPVIKTPDFYSSVISSFHTNRFLSLEDIFSQVPDHLQDHRNVMNFDEQQSKFNCSLCKCWIGLARNKTTIVNSILSHIEGKKHVRLCHHQSDCSNHLILSNEAKDENLLKVLKMSKNRVVDKNLIYVCKNTFDSINCNLCKCILPNIGKNGYLVAIANFEIHFSGWRHKKNLKYNLLQKVKEIVRHEGENLNEKCDEIVSRLFNGLPKNFLKVNAVHFMISKSSNLICKLCSCVIVDNIESSSDDELGIQIEKHIQSFKHERNYVQKVSMKYYNEVTCNLLKINNESLSLDYLQSIIKLDSCGQFVCSLCCKIIIKPYDNEIVISIQSHLKGKKHKQNNNKHNNKLTENVLIDIIDSLPSNFKINKKYLNFIFKYGIVHCNVCNFMFTACNNFRLRNNLMIHLTSTKHNYLINTLMLNNVTSNGDIVDNDFNKFNDGGSKDSSKMMPNEKSVLLNNGSDLVVKKTEYDVESYETGLFRDCDFFELLDAGNEVFFQHLFNNYIPHGLHLNLDCLVLKSKKMYCITCRSTLPTTSQFPAAAEILINHFIGVKHKKRFRLHEFLVNPSINEKKFTDKNLNNIFQNFMPKKMRCYKNQIKIISKKLYCSICQCDLLEVNNSNVTIIENLKLHFKSQVHNKKTSSLELCEKISNDKPVVSSVDGNICRDIFIENSSVNSTDTPDTLNLNNIYVNLIFKNFISSDLQSNRKYIYAKSKNFLFCCVCNCSIMLRSSKLISAAKTLMSHFKEKQHSKNINEKKGQITTEVNEIQIINDNKCHLIEGKPSSNFLVDNICKNDKTFLDDVFANYIHDDYQFNRPYLITKLGQLTCSICKCVLFKLSNPQDTAKKLMTHLQKKIHKNNLKTVVNFNVKVENQTGNSSDLDTEEETFLDNLFENFIADNLKFNKQYLTLKLNKFSCTVCCHEMIISTKPLKAAKPLMEHLKGKSHKRNLQKRFDTMNGIKPAILDSPTRNICAGVNIADKAMKNGSVFFDSNDLHKNSPNILELPTSSNDNLSNIKKVINNDDLSEFNLVETHGEQNSFKLDECFLDYAFTNLIEEDLQFNRPFMCVESDRLLCNICQCIVKETCTNSTDYYDLAEIMSVISDHLKASTHGYLLLRITEFRWETSVVKYVLKKNELNLEIFLDIAFKNFVPTYFQFQRLFITVGRHQLFCNICDYHLPLSHGKNNSFDPEFIAKLCIAHFTTEYHCIKIDERKGTGIIVDSENGGTGEASSLFEIETFSNENIFNRLFRKFIFSDLKFYRTYIFLGSNWLVCILCKCVLSKTIVAQNLAEILLLHLEGNTHHSQLKAVQFRNEISDSVKINNRFLNFIFEKFISSNHQFQLQYFTICEDKLLCNICNCPLFKHNDARITRKFLRKHLKGGTHQKNLKAILHQSRKNWDILERYKSSSHSSNMKREERNVCEVDHSSVVEHLNENEIFLDALFVCLCAEFQCNKQYIQVKSNCLFCCVCDCKIGKALKPELDAKNLMDHFKGRSHSKKIIMRKSTRTTASNEIQIVLDKKDPLVEDISLSHSVVDDVIENDKTFLDNVFANYIHSNYQFNRPYIVTKFDQLMCSLCNCTLFKSSKPQETARILMEHLQKEIHKSNSKIPLVNFNEVAEQQDITKSSGSCCNNFSPKYEGFFENPTQNFVDENVYCVTDHGKSIGISSFSKLENKKDNSSNFNTESGLFLDDLFENFIADNLKFNKQYISLQLNTLSCTICCCEITKTIKPLKAAKQLMSHLVGKVHKRTLQKSYDAVNETKQAIMDIPTRITCTDVDVTDRAMKNGTTFLKSSDVCENSAPKLERPIHSNKNISNTSIVEKNTELSESSLVDNQGEQNLCKLDESYLDYVFTNLIQDDLKFNRSFISIDSDELFCNICHCIIKCRCTNIVNYAHLTEIIAVLLGNHLKATNHGYFLSRINEFNSETPDVGYVLSKKDLNSELFLDIAFDKFVPTDFQFQRPFITVDRHQLFCYICNSHLLLNSFDPEFSAKLCITHFKGENHCRKLDERKETGIIVDSETSGTNKNDGAGEVTSQLDTESKQQQQSDTMKENEKLLNMLFKNFVSSDCQFQLQYIAINQDDLFCNVCNCILLKLTWNSYSYPDLTAKILVDHLKSKNHSRNIITGTTISSETEWTGNNDDYLLENVIENDKTFLDDVFANYIHSDYQFNRPFVVTKSDQLMCSFCNCTLFKSSKPQETSKILMEHFQKEIHKRYLKLPVVNFNKITKKQDIRNSFGPCSNNLSENCEGFSENSSSSFISTNQEGNISDLVTEVKTFLDDVFENFIADNLKFNKQYISLQLYTNTLSCTICCCEITKTIKPLKAAKQLMSHLVGKVHKRTLQKSYDAVNETKQAIMDIPTRITCTDVDVTDRAMKNGTTFLESSDACENSAPKLERPIHSNENISNTSIVEKNTLDDLFENFIADNLKFNKQYISLQLNTLSCTICCCDITKCIKPEITAKELILHLNGKLHRRKLCLEDNTRLVIRKQPIEDTIQKNTPVCTDLSHKGIRNDDKFLDLFGESNKTLPSLNFSETFSNENSSNTVIKNDSFFEKRHVNIYGNVELFKTDENALDYILTNLIPEDLKFNKLYVGMTSDGIVCYICKC